MSRPASERVPRAMKPTYEAIVALTDSFCRAHLNEEYADLSRALAAALARKRPSPLSRGGLDIWACAIVYTIGSVNFLFDSSQSPHMSAEQLCAEFGVNQHTAANKSATIRKMFGMMQFDPHWCLPSLMAENPLVWLVEFNGLIVDVRTMPRSIQEAAFRRGLIPWIPADQ